MASLNNPDICIVGAGPAGIAAAEAARRYGASVILIESDRMGGGRLHLGSVPSRALAAAAGRAHALRTAGAFGVTPDEPKVNFGRIHDHIQQVIAALAPHDSAERLTALGIEVIRGEARFADKRTLKVGDRAIRARRFIIATGSRPAVFEIPGLADVSHFTAETIFENTRKPGHLVIVGGGPLALELAQAHRRLGADVTVLARAPLLPGTDPELRDVVLERLREEGVAFRDASVPLAVTPRGAGLTVQVHEAGVEEVETLNASHLLLLGDRLPALDELDLARADVKRDKADPARLRISRIFATTNPRVYAVGAAAGAASIQAAVLHAGMAVRTALFGFGPGAEPAAAAVIYTDPELAEVGLSEPAAAARLKDRYRVVRTAFAENDRARATRETYGLAKLIVDRSGRLLGAGIVGPSAGELIATFALAVAKGLTIADLASFAAPRPTLGEIAGRLAETWEREQKPGPWVERRLRLQRMLP